jgi:hypothetical protein
MKPPITTPIEPPTEPVPKTPTYDVSTSWTGKNLLVALILVIVAVGGFMACNAATPTAAEKAAEERAAQQLSNQTGAQRNGNTMADGQAGTSGDGAGMSLSEAFCSDLRSGMTPMNILGSSVKSGTYTPSEAADKAYGMAAISCPEQLTSNKGLRTYLQGWGINPNS